MLLLNAQYGRAFTRCVAVAGNCIVISLALLLYFAGIAPSTTQGLSLVSFMFDAAGTLAYNAGRQFFTR